MLYAILAYHVEAEVTSWTPEEDAALMTDLLQVHDRLNEKSCSGRRRGSARRRMPAPCAVREPAWSRRAVCRDQGAVAGPLCGELRRRGGSDRGRPRPAPRQSDGGLRDPPDPALSSRRALPETAGEP